MGEASWKENSFGYSNIEFFRRNRIEFLTSRHSLVEVPKRYKTDRYIEQDHIFR